MPKEQSFRAAIASSRAGPGMVLLKLITSVRARCSGAHEKCLLRLRTNSYEHCYLRSWHTRTQRISAQACAHIHIYTHALPTMALILLQHQADARHTSLFYPLLTLHATAGACGSQAGQDHHDIIDHCVHELQVANKGPRPLVAHLMCAHGHTCKAKKAPMIV